MDYIQNWFHIYDTVESFNIHKKQGIINPDSICFIRESGQLYTQNSFFGICRSRFESLEKLVLAHDANIKNILGIEGNSVDNGIIDNISDLVNFLDGFTDDQNLKEFIEQLKLTIENQIKEVNDRLLQKIEETTDAIDLLNTQLNTVNTRLDGHDSSISTINNTIANHLRDYNELNRSYEAFKSYTNSKFSSIETTIGTLKNSLQQLQDNFESIQRQFNSVSNEVVALRHTIEDNKQYIDDLKDTFDQSQAALEEFKQDIQDEIDDFTSSKGEPNGVAPLDGEGVIPSRYLPSFVDDVLEYDTVTSFPAQGDTGKIYVARDTNLTYRWSGSSYIEISKSIGLGETSSTAYAGNKGKKNADDIAAHKTDYTNPHRVNKTQVGLGNVDNTRDIDKPISTAVQEALDGKVQIEPGKGLVSLADAEKIVETNLKMDVLEDALQSEIDRATTSENTISAALATHKSDNKNPHGVTKAQVGLGNVDNTADLDKPVSRAIQSALDAINSKTFSGTNYPLYKDSTDRLSMKYGKGDVRFEEELMKYVATDFVDNYVNGLGEFRTIVKIPTSTNYVPRSTQFNLVKEVVAYNIYNELEKVRMRTLEEPSISNLSITDDFIDFLCSTDEQMTIHYDNEVIDGVLLSQITDYDTSEVKYVATPAQNLVDLNLLISGYKDDSFTVKGSLYGSSNSGESITATINLNSGGRRFNLLKNKLVYKDVPTAGIFSKTTVPIKLNGDLIITKSDIDNL